MGDKPEGLPVRRGNRPSVEQQAKEAARGRVRKTKRWLKQQPGLPPKAGRSDWGGCGLDRLGSWGSRFAWIDLNQTPPELVESSGRQTTVIPKERHPRNFFCLQFKPGTSFGGRYAVKNHEIFLEDAQALVQQLLEPFHGVPGIGNQLPSFAIRCRKRAPHAGGAGASSRPKP